MSHASSQYLTQSEIESIKELDSWQRWQLEYKGNILREVKRHPILEAMANEPDEERDGNYQNSIFSQLNPQK